MRVGSAPACTICQASANNMLTAVALFTAQGVQRISEQLDTAAEQDIEMVHQADARRAAAAMKRSKKQSGTKAAGAEPSGEATSGAGDEQQQEEQEEGKAGRAAKGTSSRSSKASKASSSKATKKGAKDASAAGTNTSRSQVSTRTTRQRRADA